MAITLVTLARVTPQEVFDQVAIHLLSQKARSITEYVGDDGWGTFCAYRSTDGLQCAVGCLISDDEIRRFEIQNDGGWYLVCERTGSWKHFKLISALQQLHDTSPVETWARALKRVARKFCLDTTMLRLHSPKMRSTRQVHAGRDRFARPAPASSPEPVGLAPSV